MNPGAKLLFEQTRVNDEVWLPKRQLVSGTARIIGKKIVAGRGGHLEQLPEVPGGIEYHYAMVALKTGPSEYGMASDTRSFMAELTRKTISATAALAPAAMQAAAGTGVPTCCSS